MEVLGFFLFTDPFTPKILHAEECTNAQLPSLPVAFVVTLDLDVLEIH